MCSRRRPSFIRDESNTTGLVVVDRGRVVYQYGDIAELSYVASVRKSILAMLYGSWVENGTIKLDTTLEPLNIDDIGGLLPIEKQATIGHVITARSGVYHPASYSGDDLAQAPPRGSQKPGSYMLYSNWDFNVAGAIFEQLTGRDIYDELQAQLAIPLQFEDWDRSAQHKEGDLADFEVSRLPDLDLDARHGAHRLSDASRRPVEWTPGHLQRLGAAHRQRRDAGAGDESHPPS